VLALGAPRWDPAVRPAPKRIAEGLYEIERRFFLPGAAALPTRALVVRLAGGGVAVVSPPPDAEARRDAAALGPVRFLVAANSFHYVGIASWAAAFPEAKLLLAPGLRARRPELPAGEELHEGAALPCGDALAHTVLGPTRGVSEVALLHRPSRTLLLVDACFHIRPAASALDRLRHRLLGVPRGFGPSLTARTILLRDRALVAAFVERLCGWEFERIVVAHGEVIEGASARTLREAFRPYL
jgi:hypothetical protein